MTALARADLRASINALPLDTVPDIRYDVESDTLLLRLVRDRRSGVSMLIGGNYLLQLADDRQTAIGFHIENFRTEVLAEHPRWGIFLHAARLSRSEPSQHSDADARADTWDDAREHELEALARTYLSFAAA